MDEDMKALQKRKNELSEGLKFSRMRELQIQNRTFFNEARRLKKLADQIGEALWLPK